LSKGILLEAERRSALELQHINVKLPLREPEPVVLGAIIPIFHSWIQNQVCDELLLDVADYRHVPDGPGVVVIGHEADYSVDNTDGHLGIRYNRKAVLAGTNQDRLEQALRSALRAAQRLEEDTPANGKLTINGQDMEIWINDRLLAPHADQARQAVAAELTTFLDRIFSGTSYTLAFDSDPRKLLIARVRAEREFSASELLERVGEPKVA
jgi:hypothetical protein